MKKLLILSLFLSIIAMTGCSETQQAEVEETPVEVETEADMTETTSSNDTFMQTAVPAAGETIAVITTNHGVMKVRLFSNHTPETVKNFTELAQAQKYDGTIFHRVIKDFMIQGGDFENRNGTGGHSYKGPGTMFEDEFHPELSNIRGALSMANRGPATNGSQFFIVHAPETSWLDGKHSVFGHVYEGLEVLDAIANVQTGMMDVPVEEVILETVEIVEL